MGDPTPKKRLTCERVNHPMGTVLRFSGTIDEEFDRKTYFQGLQGTLVFDLDKVTQITSFGVREWVTALRDLNSLEVVFIRARPALVTQFNSVAQFGGNGLLLSFFAPYVCSSCNDAIEHLVDLRKLYGRIHAMEPPEVTCPRCSAPAEFDDIPEVYFSYFGSLPPPVLSPTAAALVDGMTAAPPPAAQKFRVDKEIVGTVTALWISGPLEKVGRLKRLLDGTEGDVVVILQEAEPPTVEEANSLALLVNSAAVPMHLARIPPSLVFAWAKTGVPANARVLSIQAPFHCPTCGLKLPLEASFDRLKSGQGHPCPKEGQMMVIALGMKERQILASVLVKPTQALADYLAGHLFPPKRDVPTPSGRVSMENKTPAQVAQPPPPPPAASVQDERHFGRYEILRSLGRGGMAEVFLARQLSLGGFSKTVVLKRILAQLGMDPKFVEMFLQEARLAARISHPNVVEIFDVGQVGTQYFIAMEYVQGTDLSRLLQTATRLNEPMPIELAARVAADVAAGLHAAHTCVNEKGQSMPIIHRDVSPHNVLISVDGRVKLTDFGIAKAADSGDRTPTHTIKGKLSYLAPEQVRPGMGPIDTRADIFPLGLMFFQCATLEHMFRRDTEYATLWALLNEPIKTISDFRSAPPMADAILTRALSKTPLQRYQTARVMQNELEALIVSTGKVGSPAKLAEWIRYIYDLAKARNVSTFGVDFPHTASASAITATDPEKKNS